MIVDVEIPNQGLTITEATLVRWAKQPGDLVQKGEVLFEIETDKAVQEIESPVTGYVLALLANEQDVLPLGQIVVKIGTEATDRLESDQKAKSPAVATGTPVVNVTSAVTERPAVTPSIARDDVVVSPRARRTAERLGIDLSLVQPTGGKGRHIREQDILRAAEQLAARQRQEAAPSVQPVTPTPVALSRMRQITAERTAVSFRDAPHFYLIREVSAERLVILREELVTDLEAYASVRITINDLLIKALALTLRAFPSLNAQWHDGRIVQLSSINIGIAVDTPNGLIVPVVRTADTLSLYELSRQREELVERAKAGKSKPEDLADGSFTLTNLGALEVDQFEAIINPPQSGILAVGSIKPRPYVINEQLTVSKTVFLTLSIDHRVVDGAEAARFFQHLVFLVEKPAMICAL